MAHDTPVRPDPQTSPAPEQTPPAPEQAPPVQPFSASGLLLAIAGSVVGTVLTGAAGTGPWGTLAGAAVLPVVSAVFTTRRAGERGPLRAIAAVLLLTAAAVFVTWSTVSVADTASGSSVMPGTGHRPSTFPFPGDGRGAGTGTTAARVDVDPASLDCDEVALGAQTVCSAELRYTGDGTLRVRDVEVRGDAAEDFAVDARDCDRLTDGETCTVAVLFRPSAPGTRVATVVLHQNLPAPDTGTRIPVGGTGVDSTWRPTQDFVQP